MATPENPVVPGYEPQPGDNVRSIVIAENQLEYLPLPALVVDNAEQTVITRWQLTPEEIEALKQNGGNLWMWTYTFGRGFQPTLFTFEPPVTNPTINQVEKEVAANNGGL